MSSVHKWLETQASHINNKSILIAQSTSSRYSLSEPNIPYASANCDEFAENMVKSKDDLINLWSNTHRDSDVDDNDVIISKREGSTAYGRRSLTDSAKSQLQHDLFLHLENVSESSFHNSDSLFDLDVSTERKMSARYGRRSQSNLTSRTSSSSSGNLINVNQNFNSKLSEQIDSTQSVKRNGVSEEESLIIAPGNSIPKTDDSMVKNSARYGRRAIKNNNVTVSNDNNKTRTIDAQNLIDSKHNSLTLKNVERATISSKEKKCSAKKEANYSDVTLEECWKSLKVFNKKQKGRISEDNNYKNDTPCVSPSMLMYTPEDFVIPLLPKGKIMEFDITSTWGDKHYVGLNGIELFNEAGKSIKIKEVTANPSDINVLPEYDKDPRVVKNLFDTVNRTHDDMYLWLAPFTPGAHHYIYVNFFETEIIAMIRIWVPIIFLHFIKRNNYNNYNKSRIHSYRGVRHITISLDDVCIFRGEIARANGEIQGNINTLGDTILYTLSEDILQKISENDEAYESIIDSYNTDCAMLQEQIDDRHSNSNINTFDQCLIEN